MLSVTAVSHSQTPSPTPLLTRAAPPADEVRALWEDERARADVLDGIPAADASLEVGDYSDDQGTTVTTDLRLETPAPGMATQALAGKAVRRLKALAETGETPTTDRNPSARADAGEPAG